MWNETEVVCENSTISNISVNHTHAYLHPLQHCQNALRIVLAHETLRQSFLALPVTAAAI